MNKAICALVLVMIGTSAPPALAWPGCEEDHLGAVVHDDTLTVHHDDAVYNCCLDGIDYSVTVDGNLIEILETELITESCPCLCCYDLSVSIGDLAPGNYTVLFTWQDYDTGQWEEWTDDVTVLDAGQTGTPSVVATNNSGCIDPTAAPDPELEADTWGGVKALYR